MCFDSDSRPPIHPIFGGATDARDLRLTSADGTRFMAYAARATSPTGAGMIVIPDVRGLHQYYKELALRFAEAGVDAVAIDFFARTAPSDDRSDKFDFMSQVPLTTPETLQADIAAAAAYLRGREGGGVRSLFSVGFCFGGALSYLQAASGLGYAGRHRLLRLAARAQALAGSASRPSTRCPAMPIRSSPSWAAPTRASRPARSRSSTAPARRRAWRMTPRCIPARHTASSTASRRSSRRLPRMRGAG